MQKKLKYLIGILTFFLLTGTANVMAMPEILTTQQLHPGMIGTAKTVVQGNEIESFNVKIIGVEDNGKGASKQIMAEAYGPIINDTNGVIHGMSGSPVYVDGRLIGAVARGIGSDTNPRVFYITPIEDMLQLWQFPDPKADTGQINQVKIDLPSSAQRVVADNEELARLLKKGQPAANNNMAAVTARKVTKAAKAAMQSEQQNNTAEKAVKTVKTEFVDMTNWKNKYGGEDDTVQEGIPLAVNGFSGAGLDYLKRELAPFNMYPYETGLMTTKQSTGSLVGNTAVQPGSSVGVALSYGDFSVGAIGTITAVDGNKILAFGHPFTYRGNVNYFMTDADIVGTASGLVNGQKVSSFGKIIGRINQDRYSGVSGIIGKYPSVVPIKVTVDDKLLERHNVYAANIAYDEDLLPNLAASIAYASLDRTIDSLSSGTANVEFAIRTNAVDSGKITRSNMYYNNADVGQFSVGELLQLLNIICADTNKQYDILGIDMKLSFDEKRKTASIISVVPDRAVAYPGDIVNLKVTLQPYRGQKEQILVPYTIPKNEASGEMYLEIRGGGLIPVAALAMQGVDLSPEEDKTQTASDKINDFLQTDKNNDIIVAQIAPPIMSDKEQKKAVEDALKVQKQLEESGQLGKKPAAPQEIKATTDYIIDNVVRINLAIKK